MKNINSVDDYIDSFPADVGKLLSKMRETVKKTAPNARETISYKIPSYQIDGQPLVYFGAFKNHIGLYPLPKAIEKFQKELKPYKYSKGAIQFPFNRPLPLGLITKIIKFRMDIIRSQK